MVMVHRNMLNYIYLGRSYYKTKLISFFPFFSPNTISEVVLEYNFNIFVINTLFIIIIINMFIYELCFVIVMYYICILW